jgi:hypothetical protein
MKMYRTLNGLQSDIRKSNNIPNDFILMGNYYKQVYYDYNGKLISWNSITSDDTLDMITDNRYKNGWKDCVLELYKK